MKYLVLGTMLMCAMSACSSYDEELRKQAEITAGVQAGESVAAANQDLEKKSREMEQDLRIRQRFFQGISGTYEGEATFDGGRVLKTRLILSASVPPYLSDRVRALQEVISDLNGLHLNIQIVQWDPTSGATFGCIFNQVQPDLNSGSVQMIASACPNAYSVWLSTRGKPPEALLPSDPRTNGSSEAAQAILGQDGRSVVGDLAIEMHPSHTPEVLKFFVSRVEQ